MICRFDTTGARRTFTPVDNSFFTEYLPDATEIQLKVYLYGLMQCWHPAIDENLCDALGIAEQQATEAFCHWQALGLVHILSESPLTVEYALDPVTLNADSSVKKYSELIGRINSLTAPRQLSMNELAHVYDWIEVYGLDEAAVLELISYCMEQKGRRVSINYISSVARGWADEGIKTAEAAREAIESYRLKKSGAAAVLRAWNRKRKPTGDEMALYEKWTSEWGFSDKAILAVLPRLTTAGTPNFVYLDELLERLRDENKTEKDAIDRDDEKGRRERSFARLLFDRAGKNEPVTSTQCAQIAMYLNEYAMPHELLFYAADLCRGKNEPFGAMKRLLNEWHENGVKTVADAESYQSEHEQKRKVRASRPGMGANAAYKQTPLSDAELDSLFVDLDHDLPEKQ